MRAMQQRHEGPAQMQQPQQPQQPQQQQQQHQQQEQREEQPRVGPQKLQSEGPRAVAMDTSPPVPASAAPTESRRAPADPAPTGGAPNAGFVARALARATGSGELGHGTSTEIFNLVFGTEPNASIVSAWSCHGVGFAGPAGGEDDASAAASLCLLQKHGGPCGVLAPLNALLLRHLMFPAGRPRAAGLHTGGEFPRFTDSERAVALARALADTMWRAGSAERGVLCALNPEAPELADVAHLLRGEVTCSPEDELAVWDSAASACALSSPEALARLVVVREVHSLPELVQLAARWVAPSLRSGVGALLVLLSVVLSRGGAEACASDRDPEDVRAGAPLVTQPFGHCSQEVVGLMLTGRCVGNVFDGDIDVGGGFKMRGVAGDVDVGFLTLLESLSYCTVGDFLKHPRWPVWVVGSESHYSVCCSLMPLAGAGVEGGDDQDAAGQFERKLKRAFDSRDQAGGGFVEPSALPAILEDSKLHMSDADKATLGESGIVLWGDFVTRAKELAGFDESGSGPSSERELRLSLWHLNGLAKRAPAGAVAAGGATAASARPLPTATRVELVVPPKFTPGKISAADADLEEALRRSAAEASAAADGSSPGTGAPSQVHSQLSDVLRTRWPRAQCSWSGAAPSIV